MDEITSSVRSVRRVVVGVGNCSGGIKSYNSTSTTWAIAQILDCGAPPPLIQDLGLPACCGFPERSSKEPVLRHVFDADILGLTVSTLQGTRRQRAILPKQMQKKGLTEVGGCPPMVSIL
jgi:hypothetical protein